MTTLKSMILSVGAVALMGASGLSAQTKATADIPFDFTVENTTLPAGHYTMTMPSASRGLMLIRNVEAKKAILVVAPSRESGYRQPQAKNVVVFHQSGDRYFLTSVKTDAVCGEIAPSKLERELAMDGNHPVATVIVAALNVR